MNIKIMKLINGDDIISDIDESKGLILKNPARLMMYPTEQGMSMALVPWCPYTEQEHFELNPTSVMLTITPPEELRNEYNNQFGSKLVTPPTNLIV